MDRPPPPPQSLTEATVESIRDALEVLDACRKQVKATLELGREAGAEYDAKLVSHLSWLTRNTAQVLDAIRKQEQAERKRGEMMSRDEELELVVVWSGELGPEQRRRLVDHLQTLSVDEKVLS
jgi:hypothetical protein